MRDSFKLPCSEQGAEGLRETGRDAADLLSDMWVLQQEHPAQRWIVELSKAKGSVKPLS